MIATLAELNSSTLARAADANVINWGGGQHACGHSVKDFVIQSSIKDLPSFLLFSTTLDGKGLIVLLKMHLISFTFFLGTV